MQTVCLWMRRNVAGSGLVTAAVVSLIHEEYFSKEISIYKMRFLDLFLLEI